MTSCRTAIYTLVAAGSLLMAGVQAIASEGGEPEASAIGLGQEIAIVDARPAAGTQVGRTDMAGRH